MSVHSTALDLGKLGAVNDDLTMLDHVQHRV